MKVAVVCAHCGASAMKEAGGVNRSRKKGAPVFCSRQCVGLARRVERSGYERKRLKSEYDAVRRVELADEIREKKAEYFQRTYDPEAAREHRKGRMPQHVEYCRRYYADPVKKQGKVEYDLERRKDEYADFGEAWRLLVELEREIRARMPDKYERAKAQGYYDKFKERRDGRQDRKHA